MKRPRPLTVACLALFALPALCLAQSGSVPVPPLPADDSVPDPDNAPAFYGPMFEAIAAARGSTVPPVVTRPEPGLLIVRGAAFAGTRPYAWPIRGTPIPLADIAEPNPGDDTVWFLVRPGETYEVWASAFAGDGTMVPFTFTVTPSREDMLEQFVVLARDAQALRDSLQPTFLEIVMARIRVFVRDSWSESPAAQAAPD